MRSHVPLFGTTLTVATILLTTAVLPARTFDLPAGRWWEIPRLVEYVGISNEQQERIGELVYLHAERMIDLNAEVERSKLALQRQVDRDELDPDAVRAAFRAFQSARQALELERFEMLLAVRQILSPEQWSRLTGLRDRIDEGRNRRPPPMGAPGSQERRPPGAAPGQGGYPRRPN